MDGLAHGEIGLREPSAREPERQFHVEPPAGMCPPSTAVRPPAGLMPRVERRDLPFEIFGASDAFKSPLHQVGFQRHDLSKVTWVIRTPADEGVLCWIVLRNISAASLSDPTEGCALLFGCWPYGTHRAALRSQLPGVLIARIGAWPGKQMVLDVGSPTVPVNTKSHFI